MKLLTPTSPRTPDSQVFGNGNSNFPNPPSFAQNSNSDFDSNFLRISKLSYNPPCLWSS